MLQGRFFKILGGLFILLSLLGFSWYTLSVQPEKDLWYKFNYSPFYFKLSVGETVDTQWLYRSDSTLIGIFVLVNLVFAELYASSKTRTLLASLVFFLISFLFITLLPIHVATASRLMLDKGVYFYWLGSLIIFFTLFFEN